MSRKDRAPLDEILVVDLSRMLPGAVLARQLLDLGTRLIKVEDPDGGDPMRQAPPLVGGMGLAFAAFLRGAQSVTLDLREPADADLVRRLLGRADVVVDSFRPGRLQEWGLDPDGLCAESPRLIWCSLTSWGRSGPSSKRLGHDLNIVSELGAAEQMAGQGMPRLQLADVATGLLAATAIITALFERERTGRGTIIDQPLVTGPLPFLTWSMAEAAAEAPAIVDTLLGGGCPSYRRYPCGDGKEVAVAALEEKFWASLVKALGLPHLAVSGLDFGPEGEKTAEEITQVLRSRPREHWLQLAREHDLPVSPVRDAGQAHASGVISAAGLTANLPLPDGSMLETVGPYLPSLGHTPERPAPQLGEHNEELLGESFQKA